VCGRDWPGLATLADRPAPGLGPLGGLMAALDHAAAGGFAAVLSAPCDLLFIPPDILSHLSPGPAVVADQWLLGLWPVSLAPALSDRLTEGGPRSVHAFARAANAGAVAVPGLRNVNRPGDLP
jgi:molybdopterin-guanine dinucleotide biosynthesis protein A